VNGKAYIQEAKQSPFAFSQQQPGEFKITSIAQQQKMCKSVVGDLSYAVHPLPAAQVGQGNRIFQDIHEGKRVVVSRLSKPSAHPDSNRRPSRDQIHVDGRTALHVHVPTLGVEP
jgi:hypothetical protein